MMHIVLLLFTLNNFFSAYKYILIVADPQIMENVKNKIKINHNSIANERHLGVFFSNFSLSIYFKK